MITNPICTVLNKIHNLKDLLELGFKYINNNNVFLLCTSLIVLLLVWANFQIGLN